MLESLPAVEAPGRVWLEELGDQVLGLLGDALELLRRELVLAGNYLRVKPHFVVVPERRRAREDDVENDANTPNIGFEV